MDPESFGGEHFQKYRWCKRAAVYRHSRSIQIFCCVPRCESNGFAQHKAAGKRALVKGMFLNSCWKFWFDQSNCTILQSTPIFYLWNAWNCHKVIPLNHGLLPSYAPPYKELPHRPRRRSWSVDGSRNGRNCGRSKNLGAVSGCAAFCRKWRLGTVSLWLVVFRL